MAVKVNKIAAVIRQDTSVGFHRLYQPMRFIKREKLANKVIVSGFSGSNTYGESSTALMLWDEDPVLKAFMKQSNKADVIWSNFMVNMEDMARVLDMRKHWNSKLIIDIDDNLYNVANDNPGQKNTRKFREYIELSLRIADGLTVSVPYLVDVYKHLNPNIYVNPNSIDFDLLTPKKHKNKKIRIGWEGAYGHRNDLLLVYPAIKELIKNYDIEFVVLGVSPEDGIEKPDFPVEWNKWVSFGGEDDEHNPTYLYYDKLRELNLDIAVAPLVDSEYNRGKSNLRILENTALGIPVVASPVANYKDMPIMYAATNFEWYEQLEKLIKDPKLREMQSIKQRDFTIKHFSQKDVVKPLVEWMDNLNRRQDLEP